MKRFPGNIFRGAGDYAMAAKEFGEIVHTTKDEILGDSDMRRSELSLEVATEALVQDRAASTLTWDPEKLRLKHGLNDIPTEEKRIPEITS